MKNNKISFSICQLDTQTILNHLKKCDNLFSPKLSSKVDLMEYTEKISNNAIHFCCFKNDSLIGLLAMYANNYTERKAYMTCISVLKEFQRKGIAKRLFNDAIMYAKEKKFITIQGEVRKDYPIIVFYQKLGFKKHEERTDRYLLELKTEHFRGGVY